MLSLNIVRLGGTLRLLHFSRYKKPLVRIMCLHIIHKHKVPFKYMRKFLWVLYWVLDWLGPQPQVFPQFWVAFFSAAANVLVSDHILQQELLELPGQLVQWILQISTLNLYEYLSQTWITIQENSVVHTTDYRDRNMCMISYSKSPTASTL